MDDREKQLSDTPDEGRARLNERLRQAFSEGAEGDSRRRLGRGLTTEELDRVLRHYPGDAADRRREESVESILIFADEIEAAALAAAAGAGTA